MLFNLKIYLIKNKIRQIELARAAGVSPAFMSQVINGEKALPAARIEKIRSKEKFRHIPARHFKRTSRAA